MILSCFLEIECILLLILDDNYNNSYNNTNMILDNMQDALNSCSVSFPSKWIIWGFRWSLGVIQFAMPFAAPPPRSIKRAGELDVNFI